MLFGITSMDLQFITLSEGKENIIKTNIYHMWNLENRFK